MQFLLSYILFISKQSLHLKVCPSKEKNRYTCTTCPLGILRNRCNRRYRPSDELAQFAQDQGLPRDPRLSVSNQVSPRQTTTAGAFWVPGARSEVGRSGESYPGLYRQGHPSWAEFVKMVSGEAVWEIDLQPWAH